MIFNSVQFLVFFPIVVLVYYLIPDRIKYLWLLGCSYYFYMCWNAKYVMLLLFSTVVTYLCGVILQTLKQHQQEIKHVVVLKKLCVTVSFVLNLGILFFFKYFDFAIENINYILSSFHFQLQNPSFDVLLPVGISFYTFQALGYTVDVYRDEIYAEKNFLRYALFVSFFPQLVAGPIERSKNLLKQLSSIPKTTFSDMKEGVLLMLWGGILKVVLADRIAIFVDTIFGDHWMQYEGGYYLVAAVLFAFQIYCDFAGYSIIAMGTAKILGICLMENFNAPYLSHSTAEFWRRWHISLSTWFRDYLYIPLGGNRKGKFRKYFNLMITFGISGLWHGANWTYIVWGLLNGIYQVIGDLTQKIRNRTMDILDIDATAAGHRVLQVMLTFVCVDTAWIFFRADNLVMAVSMIKSIITVHNPWIFVDGSLFECGLDENNFRLVIFGIIGLMLADICKYKDIKIREVILKQNVWCQALVISTGVLCLLIFGIWGSAYNAANFIYFQF